MRSVFWASCWVVSALSLHGCAWVSEEELAARQDIDQDGYASSQFGGDDCDDGTAAVSPAAEEACNGADDDCDGQVDNVEAGPDTTWYTDADGDGAGDASAVQAACEQPEGAVANATDCDDQNDAVLPGAAEICNGVDDDCDGLLDDGDDSFAGQTWVPDADGDGVGGEGETVQTADCEPPVGYTVEAGDCDDANPAVAPGLDEVCDGLDNDCDALIDDEDDGVVGVPTWYLDDDGDGFGDEAVPLAQCDAPGSFVADASDCDDADALVYPGAAEHCDDRDEDCDGEADDSAIDVTPWYTDGDGDGYGDDTASVTACDAPTGTVGTPGDCDDTDAAIYPYAVEECTEEDTNCDGQPGARDEDGDGVRGCDGDCDDEDPAVSPDEAEICNDGLDDDCDGLADDDDPDRVTTGLDRYYPDEDGDGYGDADDAGSYACSLPEGRAESHDDCDDGDGGTHPEATELCSTDVDDDCDGDTDDCSLSLGSVGLSFVGETEGDLAGSATVSADLDGDGRGDLAVAAPGRGSARGSVYVVLNPVDASGELADEAEWNGSGASDGAGTALALAGDLDGDELADFGVGAPGAEQVYVLAGPADAGGGLTGAETVVSGSETGSGFGAALWFGDLDHDGYTDLAVGAPQEDQVNLLGLAVADSGEVDVFYGPLSATLSSSDASASFLDDDTDTNAALGRALAGADADGDGRVELLISGYENNGLGTLTPKIYLVDLSGGAALDVADVDRTFSGASGRESGAALSAEGDVDGDGSADLIVGDSEAGQAFLLLGPIGSAPTTLSSGDAVITGSADFGLAVGILPDLDGDGIDELAVGGDNAAVLWMGGSDLLGALTPSSADLGVDGARSADQAGAAIWASDLDGDGSEDLGVGAPGADSEVGVAWALLGPF